MYSTYAAFASKSLATRVMYEGYLTGLTIAVFAHHFVASLFTLKFKDGLKGLKTLFAFSGLARSVMDLVSLQIPYNVSENGCYAIEYANVLSALLYRISLVAFLLYILAQVDEKKLNRLKGLLMLSLSLILEIAYVAFCKPARIPVPQSTYFTCQMKENYGATPIKYTALAIELATALFVTIRFTQILIQKGEDNFSTHSVDSFTKKPRNFKALLFYNLSRLSIAVLIFLEEVLGVQALTYVNESITVSFYTLFSICMGYVVCIDAEFRPILGDGTLTTSTTATTLKSNALIESTKITGTTLRSFSSPSARTPETSSSSRRQQLDPISDSIFEIESGNSKGEVSVKEANDEGEKTVGSLGNRV